MILVIQSGKVLATHTDAQKAEITFALYPLAEKIVQIYNGILVNAGDDDPTIAHPEYIVDSGVNLAHLYATLTFSGGDGKTPIGLKLGHPSRGVMDISGDVRATPDTPGLPVNITFEWRVTVRKVVSEFDQTPIDSYPVDGCQVVNNLIQWQGFNPETLGMSPGIYLISDADFATIPGASFGLPQDYSVKLVGGAKVFKVLK